jgi:hypothetical protein
MVGGLGGNHVHRRQEAPLGVSRPPCSSPPHSPQHQPMQLCRLNVFGTSTSHGRLAGRNRSVTSLPGSCGGSRGAPRRPTTRVTHGAVHTAYCKSTAATSGGQPAWATYAPAPISPTRGAT